MGSINDGIPSAGDLNNVSAMRSVELPTRDPAFAYRSLALQSSEDDPVVRARYRPFLLPEGIQRTDWISRLELATVVQMADDDIQTTGSRLKILILYGSLREK